MTDVMRSQDLRFGVTPTNFRAKIQKQVAEQFNDIYRLMGSIVVAPLFLLAALHAFKRPDTASLKWGLLSMWLLGVFGPQHGKVGVTVLGLPWYS